MRANGVQLVEHACMDFRRWWRRLTWRALALGGAHVRASSRCDSDGLFLLLRFSKHHPQAQPDLNVELEEQSKAASVLLDRVNVDALADLEHTRHETELRADHVPVRPHRRGELNTGCPKTHRNRASSLSLPPPPTLAPLMTPREERRRLRPRRTFATQAVGDSGGTKSEGVRFC